jgi:hypothetical protein
VIWLQATRGRWVVLSQACMGRRRTPTRDSTLIAPAPIAGRQDTPEELRSLYSGSQWIEQQQRASPELRMFVHGDYHDARRGPCLALPAPSMACSPTMPIGLHHPSTTFPHCVQACPLLHLPRAHPAAPILIPSHHFRLRGPSSSPRRAHVLD